MKLNKRVLGITGGVGAGKSTVLEYLKEQYNAFVIQADLVGRKLQEKDGGCFRAVLELFGEQVLAEDGSFDRKKLAQAAFGDSEKLEKLNQIMHPAIREEIIQSIREKKSSSDALIVVEAALFFEDKYDDFCDECWYIYTKPDVRTQRLIQSRGYTSEKIQQMMKNQMSEKEYREKCTLVIDNSSDFVENTFEQIDKGLKEHGFM